MKIFPIGTYIWILDLYLVEPFEELVGVSLLEEVHYCGWTLNFQKAQPFQLSSLHLMLVNQDVKFSATA